MSLYCTTASYLVSYNTEYNATISKHVVIDDVILSHLISFYLVSSHFISSDLTWSCLLLHLLYYARQKSHEDGVVVVASSTKDDTLSIENQVQESIHEPLDLFKMCDGWLPSRSISTPFQKKKKKAFVEATFFTAAASDALQNVLKGQASHLHTTMHTFDSPVCVQHMIDGEEKQGKVPVSTHVCVPSIAVQM